MKVSEHKYTATRNACKMCAPLGASLAFKGIRDCVPLIHGSQGCSTYIRRYMISHFKEPVDIASTNFTEDSAVFGGERNLFTALDNITKQYRPAVICIATTCLSETIGDDMHSLLDRYRQQRKKIPELVFVNTPSYMGSHADAFHNACLSLVKSFARNTGRKKSINIFPGILSPADLRMLKDLSADFGIECIMMPDYSETLDYEFTGEYEKLAPGGTSIDQITETGSSLASVELGYILNKTAPNKLSPGEYLEKEFSVPNLRTGIPMGIKETDRFLSILEKVSGTAIPEKYKKERGRLIDAYVDGHKYVFGKKAVVYGDEDFVSALTGFLDEIGMETVLCASGGNSGKLSQNLEENIKPDGEYRVADNYDFEEIAEACRELKPDILIGNSKGYYISRELGIPLVRLGFPIHDRLGGQRLKHILYSGTMELFERIANTLIAYRQDNSPVGYKYM